MCDGFPPLETKTDRVVFFLGRTVKFENPFLFLHHSLKSFAEIHILNCGFLHGKLNFTLDICAAIHE
jgi:hypothetical protein